MGLCGMCAIAHGRDDSATAMCANFAMRPQANAARCVTVDMAHSHVNAHRIQQLTSGTSALAPASFPDQQVSVWHRLARRAHCTLPGRGEIWRAAGRAAGQAWLLCLYMFLRRPDGQA
jgi:hypothetical protein